jgi:hypothetical protein
MKQYYNEQLEQRKEILFNIHKTVDVMMQFSKESVAT